MLAAYATSQYQEMQVQTTPGKLVVMLYDGALRFLNLALDALHRRDLEAQGRHLGRAQGILYHLMATLDPGAGPLAANLEQIYRYCLARLLAANADDNAAYIEEVIRLLSPLRDAWEQAERSVHAGAPALAGVGA